MMETATISGMVAAHNEPTVNKHICLPGAFGTLIKNIPLVIFHRDHLIAGKTIDLFETEEGLFHESELDLTTPTGRDTKKTH